MYLRKSRTDDPALTVQETLEKHEKMLDDYAVRTWGERIPERNRFREVVSGETIDARPEVQRVLRLAELPQYKALLIVEPQRLSRGDLEDIGRVSKILRYTGTLVITLQGAYDLTDERDRDYFERELKRGNEYLGYQKRIMGNGRMASVERGNYLGTTAPYGYARVWIREGKKKAPSLDVVQDEAETVRLIFRLFAEGSGASAICARLNAAGTPSRSGRPWRQSSIYAILDNPVYIGLVRWQSTREERVVVNGELEKHRPRQTDYPTFPGKHPAIVTEALWEAARARRAARSTPRVNPCHELKNPFAGLVRCSCGAAVVLITSNGYPRLRCLERHVCKTASCKYDDFVAAVTEALRENVENLETVIGGAAPDNAEDVQRLRRRVEALAQKETALWEKYAEGMPRAIFDELLAKTHADQRAVEALLSAELERYSCRETLDVQAVTLHAALDLLADLDTVPANEANRLLRACIKRITYHRAPAEKAPPRAPGRAPSGNRGGWEKSPIELSIELAF